MQLRNIIKYIVDKQLTKGAVKMVVFENPGSIDIKSAMLFGISAKSSESAIGFFGTGLKYAIAVALRNGYKVEVHTDNKVHQFTLKDINFREKAFEIIQLDGQDLSFTSELGKTWAPWMAYREFYCNAKDENGTAYIGSIPNNTTGKTFVTVQSAEFEDVHNNRDDFILCTTPVAHEAGIEFHEGYTNAFFYKGIKVFQGIVNFAMHYNCTKAFALTEDRTVKHTYELEWRIRDAITELKDESLISKLLTVGTGYFEHDINFASETDYSQEFMSVARRLNSTFAVNLNPSIKRLVAKWSKEDWSADHFTPTAQQLRALEKAKSFLERCNYQISTYPIKFKRYLGEGVLAFVHEDIIYLSETAMNQGVKQLCSTLLEEYVHLVTNLKDETYALQTYLFDKVITLHEEILQEVL